MSKYTQFAKENWWRIIIAIIFLTIVIASIYFKWKTVAVAVVWILLGGNFFYLVYKNYQRRSSRE
ncbi:MAG: hypothetical protein EOP47_13340 [Sphingobacteriaceae bacterium]|nr:MAG: hypothetical protein EOP47_13340 [Sphingobacteriaceae bacterium]